MKLERLEPQLELVAVNHSYSTRIEDSFGPWAVDFLDRQHHDAETAKPKTVEIITA